MRNGKSVKARNVLRGSSSRVKGGGESEDTSGEGREKTRI